MKGRCPLHLKYLTAPAAYWKKSAATSPIDTGVAQSVKPLLCSDFGIYWRQKDSDNRAYMYVVQS